MADEKKSNIRPRRLEFVKFLAVEYHMYAPPACSAEDAGKVLQDLIVSIYNNEEPKYEANRRAILESYEYIENKNAKIAEWKKRQKENKQKENKKEDANMFEKKSIPDNWQSMQRHELEKLMLAAGITQEQFHIWYEDTKANEWRDKKYNNPIRDPIAACKAYSKFKPQKEYGDG